METILLPPRVAGGEDGDSDSVCLICLQVYEENEKSDAEKLKHYQNVFNKVAQHLSSEVFENCFQWNFAEQGSLPVCANCYSSMEKLFKLNEVMEKVQTKMQELIISFTNEVLTHHKRLEYLYSSKYDTTLSDVNILSESPTFSVIEYDPDTEIEIKDECLEKQLELDAGIISSSEDFGNDGDDDDTESNTLNLETGKIVDQEINIHENKSYSPEKEPPANNDIVEDHTVNNSSPYSNFLLKPLKIVLTRLQLDSDVNVSTTLEDVRPRRKAALAATASFKKIINAERTGLGLGSEISKGNNISTAQQSQSSSRRKAVLTVRNICSDSDWQSDLEIERSKSGNSSNYSDGESEMEKIKKIQSTRSTCKIPRVYQIAKRYKCQFKSCSLSFNFTKEIQSHSLKSGHKNEKLFKCTENKCTIAFFSQKDRRIHLNSHQSPHKCTTCLKKFRSNHRLQIHQNKSHIEKRFKCDICDKEFMRKLRLTQHKRLHEKNCFECDKCSAKFVWKLSLKQHIQIEHDKEKYKCSFCSKLFGSKLQITRHRLIHFKSKIKKIFQCAACKKIHFVERVWDNCVIKHFRKRRQKDVICAICTSNFKTYRELEDHSKNMSHQNKKLFQCRLCKKRFFKSVHLKKHKECHRSTSKGKATQGPFECHVCLKLFKQKSYLKNHIEWHNNPDKFKCEICEKQYKNIPDLRYHGRTHSDEKRYKCKICKEKFLRRHELKTHSNYCKKSSETKIDKRYKFVETVKSGTKMYECKFCDSTFKSKGKLILHQKAHKGKKRKIPCKFCGKIYKRDSMWNHFKTHSTEKKFKCGKCELAFNMKGKLERHEISAHTEERPFACNKCDMKFKTQTYLNMHMQRSHLSSRVLCDVCGKNFAGPNQLRAHKRLHTGTMFNCTYDGCERKFYDRYALSLHAKLVHTKELHLQNKVKRYSCELCDKKYTLKSTLNIHLRSHTNERPCKCHICDKRFLDKKKLGLHMKKNHAEKNIKCDWCEKYFSCKESLQTHTKNSHGEKTFQCEFCSYMCRQQTHLQTHIRTQHTNERPFVCDICGKSFARKNNMDIHIRSVHEKMKKIEKEMTDTDTETESD